MIHDIITYPDERINLASADVRFFDEELHELIDEMKETAQSVGSRGLTAIQIAIPRGIVVVLDESGEWQEYINPRIIKHKGKVMSSETTLYLPDVVESVPRFQSFSFLYQDRYGKQHTGVAYGEHGFLLQRKFDYIFGGTFINKLGKKHRKEVESKFAKEGIKAEFNTCPTFSKREYFKSAMNKLLFFEALSWSAPLFGASTETLSSLWSYTQFATIAVLLLIVGYLIYSKYEADRYTSCTGCQVASFAAVALKYLVIATIFYTASYYWIEPTSAL